MDKKRILIVDDEITITRLLKLNLERTNHYVVQVENNAARALAAVEQFHPDLILLDVMMPGQDGGELASRIQSSPKRKDIPIVFFTAAAKKQEVNAQGGHIGGFPFLAKPVDLSEVLACLELHLGKPNQPK